MELSVGGVSWVLSVNAVARRAVRGVDIKLTSVGSKLIMLNQVRRGDGVR